MIIPVLGSVIVILIIVLGIVITRKPKTNIVASKPAVSLGSNDGIFGISFTRGENEILDFIDNVENRSSDTLRSILCSVLSDEQMSKLITGPNTSISCKKVTERLDKIKQMVQVKVKSGMFKSEAVKAIAVVFSEEAASVYEKIKARLCTSDETIIKSSTITDMIKDARTKFCKNSKLVELKPIFQDITRIRSGNIA